MSDDIGDLSELDTTDKSSLVNAINEEQGKIDILSNYSLTARSMNITVSVSTSNVNKWVSTDTVPTVDGFTPISYVIRTYSVGTTDTYDVMTRIVNNTLQIKATASQSYTISGYVLYIKN